MSSEPVDLSVLTLVRNRNTLLARVIAGLTAAERPPAELVVAWCGGEDPRAVVPPSSALAVRIIEVGHGGERIPYSEARNAAAAAAGSSNLAFLDADCIPGPAYAASLATTLDEVDALATGEVWYLPPEPPPSFDPATLRALGRHHPHRERPPDRGWRSSDHHEQVWGLHMAFRAGTFARLGGFDEQYQGYAGEDTDLAVTARAAGVPVALVAGAEVFHQHHDVWEPPVQQLRATLANATTFRRKWGRWPMEGWLAELDRLGFIAWDPAATEAPVLRDPDEQDLAAAHREAALPFRTSA
ncbi:glycosyltransferase [Aquihabitans sp. G128]|uniref:glycosyltransferase family 2 protein n=1 Tax=Aquihabitans sp. G128 TaxID=2849779 RepID=UPI001C22DD3D|nr:glycosyltransferase [Aquihabitans sp. G128]QXC60846.1 glycosyltransferase [Aquihabitans sp. G128]